MDEKDVKYLRNLRDLGHSCAEVFKLYFDKLESTGFSGADPYLAEKVTNALQSVIGDTKLTRAISALKNPSFKDAFHVFGMYHDYGAEIYEVYQVILQNKLDLSKEGTYTSSGTTLTTSYLQALMEIYGNAMEVYQRWHVELDAPNLHTVLIKYLPTVTKLKEVEEITDLYLSYVQKQRGDRVIDLYAALLQTIIDTHTKPDGNREIMKYVIRTLEKIKTQVLEMPRTAGMQNREVNTIQHLVQCYNLVPDGPSRPLEDLITELGVEPPTIKAPLNMARLTTILNQVAKLLSKPDKTYGFIVWHKVIKHPMEHNLWGLMDPIYISNHKLDQSPELGINAKLIERTRTLRTLDDPEELPKSSEIIVCKKEFTPKSERFFYILESLDTINYRFLVPWQLNPHNRILHVPEAWVENIPNVKYTPSLRLESYNMVLNAEILKSLQKPLVTPTARDELRKDELYWKNTRLKIKRKAVELLKKMFEDVEHPKYEQIARKSFYEDLILEITDLIQVENIHKLPTGIIREQLDGELLLSYNRELDRLRRNLQRDIDNIYKRDYQKKLGSTPSKSKLIETIELILDEVLETYINRRSNIYLTIDAKFAILEKTLLKSNK
jgi:hypothetical protein